MLVRKWQFLITFSTESCKIPYSYEWNKKKGQIMVMVFLSFFSFSKLLKLIYSEKATQFCEIFTLFLSYVVPVKSKVKISQKFLWPSQHIWTLQIMSISLSTAAVYCLLPTRKVKHIDTNSAFAQFSMEYYSSYFFSYLGIQKKHLFTSFHRFIYLV